MTCAPADAAAMPQRPTPAPSSKTRLPATLRRKEISPLSSSSSRVSTSAPSHTLQNPVVAATVYPSSKKLGSTQSSSSSPSAFDVGDASVSPASSPDMSRRTMRRLTPANGMTSVASLHSISPWSL